MLVNDMPLLIEVLKFTIPFWLINISLNGVYVTKLIFPVVAKCDRPLDLYKQFSNGTRVLGNSTTVIGFFVAIIVGIIVQIFLGKDLEHSLQIGLISGLAVYFGHAIGSFIKRRFDYVDGAFMPFVDHGDYIILAGLIFGLMHEFSWTVIGVGVLITYILHPLFTYAAYLLKLHKQPL